MTKRMLQLLSMTLLLGLAFPAHEAGPDPLIRGKLLKPQEMMSVVGGIVCNDTCVDTGTACAENTTVCSEEGQDCVICLSQTKSECREGSGSGCQDSTDPCIGTEGVCVETKAGLGCSGMGPDTCGSAPFCG